MPEPTNAPPSKRFTITSPITLCTVGLTAALVTVAYIRRSSTTKLVNSFGKLSWGFVDKFLIKRHGHGWRHHLLCRSNDMLFKLGEQLTSTKQLPGPGSARFYACRNVYKLGLIGDTLTLSFLSCLV